MSLTLVTIPISHYCERARWALEYAGVEYSEEQNLQPFSWKAARAAGGGKMVPVLVTPERVISDSAEIVQFADGRAPAERKLYPAEPNLRTEIDALERAHEGDFGVLSRRLMYFHFFQWPLGVLRYNRGYAPFIQQLGFVLGYPLFKPKFQRYLNVNEQSALEAKEAVERVFEDVGQRLADGRRFLVGDKFTAADLTFACMAAAVVVPAPYGVPLPQPSDLPPKLRSIVEHFRSKPAGQFALKMFREHRPPPRTR